MVKLSPVAARCNQRLLYMFTGYDGGLSFCDWRFKIIEGEHDPELAQELNLLLGKLDAILEYCGAQYD